MTSWSQGRGWEKRDKREIVTYIYFQKEKQMANCILYCIFVGFSMAKSCHLKACETVKYRINLHSCC